MMTLSHRNRYKCKIYSMWKSAYLNHLRKL